MTDPYILLLAADAATMARGLGAALPYVNRAVDVARQRGLLSFLPLALRRQAVELVWASQFDLAYAAAQEGYRLSLDVGYGAAWHLMNLAAVEATWGQDQDAPRLTAPGRSDISPALALEAMPDAIEAGTRAGRRQEAAQRLEHLRTGVAAVPTQTSTRCWPGVRRCWESGIPMRRSVRLCRPPRRYRGPWAPACCDSCCHDRPVLCANDHAEATRGPRSRPSSGTYYAAVPGYPRLGWSSPLAC